MHADPAPLRVLVVDDQPELRHSMLAAVSLAGHRCVTAASAEEATACCAETGFDCILLDEVLGEQSGLELAATLRQAPSQRGARIVIVSGLEESFFRAAIDDGIIDGYLEKPVGLEELIRSLGA